MSVVNALLLAASLLLWRVAAPQHGQAKNPQKLVSPSAYRNIPNGIRTELERRGCLIPETQVSDGGGEPINIISGSFAGKTQLDWAAVCVIDDRPEIIVVWSDGAASCSAEIHSGWPLKQKFSEEPAGGIFLRRASAQRVIKYRRSFPEGKQPPITHDGLEVGNEQASLIYYCDSGKWLELRGND